MKKIINLIKKYIKRILYFINEQRLFKNPNIESQNKNNLKEILSYNSNIKHITAIDLNLDNSYKWVGAVNYNNNMYCIANTIDKVLKINLENNNIKYLKFDSENLQKKFYWTGGCIYKDKIYGFPRCSNKLLCIDPKTDTISTINLNIKYDEEHHYGGVCTKDGIIYQPPRSNNTILVINLNNLSTHEIKIAPKFLKYRYLSGVQHTNGLIYFFPERNEKVLVLNPKNEKCYFIGEKINCMVFDSAIGEDDNIYGFSGYENGILKIDVKKQNAKMICTNIGIPGCYGSKLGINGKIYGIPGNGKYFWEFNVKTQKAKKIFEVEDDIKAKCAGGIVTKEGNIYTVPALGNKIYKIEFDNNKGLSETELNSAYFTDNY